MGESAAQKIKRRQREREIIEAQEAQEAQRSRPIARNPGPASGAPDYRGLIPPSRAVFGGSLVSGDRPTGYGRSASRSGLDREPPATAALRTGAPQHRPLAAPVPDSGGFGDVGHPGFAESLIPVWGSGREALADLHDHDYAGAGLNAALAASDLFLVESAANAVRKGGLYAVKGAIGKKGTKAGWKAVRKELGDRGMLAPKQHGHHWFIPQRRWGKAVPDQIKNHPLNIKGMPSAEVHGRITGGYKGKPQFNVLERYWNGTPAWSKVLTFDAPGHPIAAARASARREDEE